MYESQLHDLFEAKKLGYQFKTVEGDVLEVIEFGKRNYDSGPDFQFAKIRHKGLEWSGHIEFHIKASDWYRHQHQDDPNYDNVIAHFVLSYDKKVKSGEYTLPTVTLQNKIDQISFSGKKSSLICERQLKELPDTLLTEQLNFALTQRLERKLEEAAFLFRLNKECPSRAAAMIMARYISPKANQSSFERLIEVVPFQYWGAELNLKEWEAILFTLSGLIPSNSEDDYVIQLIQIAEKFNLKAQMGESEWKYARMRPSGQPIFKIAQLAAIVQTMSETKKLFLNLNQLQQLTLSPYWKSHLNFTKESKVASQKLGKSLIQKLCINAMFPIQSLMISKVRESQLEFHKTLLYKMTPEQNSAVNQMIETGFTAHSAASTQALIEQKNELCQQKKCLLCKIGQALLYP